MKNSAESDKINGYKSSGTNETQGTFASESQVWDMENTKTNKITEGVIWQQLLLFFFPILFGTFFQQLYNAVDAIIVGQFVGKEALSAVGGGTGTFINLLVGFFVDVSSGATVVISQYYGARNKGMVHSAVHTAIAFSMASAVKRTSKGP